MKNLRKNELMYSLFGKRPGHTCQECCNLAKIQAGQRVVRKCKCYGLSASQATDWSKKFEACGLLGKVIKDGLEKPLFIPELEGLQNLPPDGQMEMFELTKEDK